MATNNAKSTELAAQESAELEAVSSDELALSDAALADVGLDDLIVPMLKVTQPLTEEVTDGSASPGEFLNSVTGESYGENIEFIVVSYQKGRFQADKKGNILVASPDSKGLSPKGVPFTEDPDAEEQYKAAVNRGEKEWGEGPPIATTHNFIGLIIQDGVLSEMPVRLSVSRASAPVARKWLTTLKFTKPLWGRHFALSIKQEKGDKGTYYVPVVRPAGTSSADERQAAVSLAQAVGAGEVSLVEDKPEKTTPDAPVSEPGIDI